MMMAAEDLLLQAPEERILFADDWRKELAGVLPTLPAGTLAVFTGRHWLDAGGVWADFAAVAAATGRKVVRFNDIEAEPCTDTVERMVEFLSSVSASAVIAVGGGSVMDAAKAALLVRESGMPLGELFGVDRYSTEHPEAKPARVLCIPTTSGTGSEATPYSNIVDRKLGVKKLISEHLIVPETAIVSPSLAAAMPKALTLATGCDALAHSIEGFLNTGADGNEPRANAWALESIRLIRGALPAAVADGSCREARAAMARAATLGGMVIRFKSTGLPHLCPSLQLLLVRAPGSRHCRCDAAARFVALLSGQSGGGGADDAAGADFSGKESGGGDHLVPRFSGPAGCAEGAPGVSRHHPGTAGGDCGFGGRKPDETGTCSSAGAGRGVARNSFRHIETSV